MKLISLTMSRLSRRTQPSVEDLPLIDLLMLLCAVLASLAAGVLAAYGVCVSLFGLFRTHARQAPVKDAVRTAAPSPVPRADVL
jgi:hypothetical protein